MISHIVLFNPKAGLTADQKRSFALAITDSCRAIQTIKSARIGRAKDIDPGYSRYIGEKTYKYAAVLDFESEEDLIGYLQHPLHRKLGQLFWEICESTVVIEVQMWDGMSAETADVLAE